MRAHCAVRHALRNTKALSCASIRSIGIHDLRAE